MDLDLNLSLTKHNDANVRTRTLSCSLLPTLQGNPNNNCCSRRFQYYCTSLAALAVYIWYKLECFDDRLYYLSVDSLSHLHAAMRDGHSAVVLEHGDRGVVVAVRVQWKLHRHQADSPLLPNICLEKQSVLFFLMGKTPQDSLLFWKAVKMLDQKVLCMLTTVNSYNNSSMLESIKIQYNLFPLLGGGNFSQTFWFSRPQRVLLDEIS